MTEGRARHLSDELLLLWQSGELPAGDREWAATHLEHCASCDRRLRETESILGELGQVCRQQDGERFSSLLSSVGPSRNSFFRTWRPAWAALPAAALGTAFLIWNSSVPVVKATELVDRAVREETLHPGRVVRFHVRDAQGTCDQFSTLYRSRDGACERMRARMDSANWDWAHPLSARTFEHWRRTLPAKRDAVTERAGSVILRTSTSSGVVRVATLEVRNSDFHAVAVQLEFDGPEQIQITEDSRPDLVASAGLEPPVSPPPSSPVPVPERLPQFNPDMLDQAEIRTRVALHHVRADLGHEVAVRRERQALELFALVRDTARQQEIMASLDGIPGLHIRMKTYAEFEPGDDASFPQSEQGNMLPPLARKWLKDRYPDLEQSARFVNSATQAAGALLGEAAVLEELSGRAAALSRNPAYQQLAAVRRDHQERMKSLLSTLAAAVEPLTGPLGATRSISYEQARTLASAVARCLSASRPDSSLEAEIARIRSVYDGAR